MFMCKRYQDSSDIQRFTELYLIGDLYFTILLNNLTIVF